VQPAHLCWRRESMVKVANHSDGDASGCNAIDPGGRARLRLLVPAVADLQLAIDGAVTVTDDEVVREGSDRLAERLSVAGGRARLVNVNVLPPVGRGLHLRIEDHIQ